LTSPRLDVVLAVAPKRPALVDWLSQAAANVLEALPEETLSIGAAAVVSGLMGRSTSINNSPFKRLDQKCCASFFENPFMLSADHLLINTQGAVAGAVPCVRSGGFVSDAGKVESHFWLELALGVTRDSITSQFI